ncbi:MAG: cyclase [Anaerolineaceae bacterium]|nr:MAG: cyclase [Anaerolineaceae bacterium]
MSNPIELLLSEMGTSKMSPSAYDVAWLARLNDVLPEIGNPALSWLGENQLEDGSWGSRAPVYYHDRVISTLSAMIALSRRGRRSHDKAQVDKGLMALEQITSNATKGLMADPNGATIGFELIVPTLVTEAERLGIIKQQGERILGRLQQLRKVKLRKMVGYKINRNVTMAFSAEMAGIDNQDLLDIENLQESNGSVGHSPSATAYFVKYVREGDEKAIKYLKSVLSPDGAVPNLYPFEVYEIAWMIWNLALTENVGNRKEHYFGKALDYLQATWNPEKGIALSSGFSVPDGDNTCIIFELLSRFGRKANINGLLAFEEKEHFRCYDLEADLSSSVNIHALGALHSAGFESNHPSVQKVIRFVDGRQTPHGYWFDKWHISPYYTTSHAIILGSLVSADFVNKAMSWMLNTQRPDGSWGFYIPTVEETAYCIQALSILKKQGKKIPSDIIVKGVRWIQKHQDNPFELFWIGKGLYGGELIIRSVILSALLLAEEIVKK